VRARPVGPDLFVDLGGGISRTLRLDRVTAIEDAVARAIRAELPQAEVTITTHPRALDDETVLERIMVIARNRALAVHHVTVHSIGGRLAVSTDLEVDGALGLNAAHEIADDLEAAVRDELGPEVEVETRIEPMQTDRLAGRDAGPERIAQVRGELTALAAQAGFVGEVHDVRVRDTPDGEIVNFHCYVDPALTVRDVHEKVDDVERGLRRRWPSIKRVIGHAEPKEKSE